MAVPVCGPRYSLCCVIISIWGVIQLGLMGVFFRVRAPSLAEDLPINEEEWEAQGHTYEYISKAYDQNSNNCFIAAGAYVGVFAISFIMWRINQRSNYQMA